MAEIYRLYDPEDTCVDVLAFLAGEPVTSSEVLVLSVNGERVVITLANLDEEKRRFIEKMQ